ncbi:MAG: hypothetical protein ACYTFW_05275 [Planctomycetota bacterium]
MDSQRILRVIPEKLAIKVKRITPMKTRKLGKKAPAFRRKRVFGDSRGLKKYSFKILFV